MSVTSIVSDPTQPGFNAYCTQAFAIQYDADRPSTVVPSKFVAAGSIIQQQAILWATKLLDSAWDWNGVVATYTQPLLWPRWGMFRRNGLDLIPNTVIPTELQQATAEFARQLVVSDRASDSDIETQRITSVKAGSVAVTFALGVTSRVVPDAVFLLIPSWWGIPRTRSSSSRDLLRT